MLSSVFAFLARLFGRTTMSPVAMAAPVAPADTSTPATPRTPVPSAVQVAATAAPSMPVPVAAPATAAPIPAPPSVAWLELCLPFTKHFETCQLVAYCDPGSPRGRALARAGLWYAYLRDRSIGDRAGYASLDPAPWTCGWGSTGSDVTKDTTWTQAQADARLRTQLNDAGASVNRRVKVTLTPAQKAALGDFTFNEGEEALAASTLLRLLNASDFVAAANQFARWDLAGEHVLPGLDARRAAERDLFTTGQWSPK